MQSLAAKSRAKAKRAILSSAFKRCPRCGQTKTRTHTFQETGYCGPCHNKQNREQDRMYKTHPKTPSNCSRCGKTSGRIVRDHSHSSGKFRRFLCESCNAKASVSK